MADVLVILYVTNVLLCRWLGRDTAGDSVHHDAVDLCARREAADPCGAPAIHNRDFAVCTVSTGGDQRA